MAVTVAEKGSRLEIAVEAIQRVLFHISPNLAKEALSFERRKILMINRVRYEYDLWITARLAQGYNAIYVFECKNWEEKVDPKEIVYFSEKIDATQATAGFFVAKAFTKHAEAQAALDHRITLLHAVEYPIDVEAFPAMGNVIASKRRRGFKIFEFGDAETKLDIANVPVTCVANGQPINFNDLIDEMRDSAIEADMTLLLDQEFPDGEHRRQFEYIFQHARGVLVVNGHDIAETWVLVEYLARVQHVAVESNFEVRTQGRVITYEPLILGGRAFRFQQIFIPVARANA